MFSLGLGHRGAPDLDHDGVAVELADEGQGFNQHLGFLDGFQSLDAHGSPLSQVV